LRLETHSPKKNGQRNSFSSPSPPFTNRFLPLPHPSSFPIKKETRVPLNSFPPVPFFQPVLYRALYPPFSSLLHFPPLPPLTLHPSSHLLNNCNSPPGERKCESSPSPLPSSSLLLLSLPPPSTYPSPIQSLLNNCKSPSGERKCESTINNTKHDTTESKNLVSSDPYKIFSA
jgi:hypothetical protein